MDENEEDQQPTFTEVCKKIVARQELTPAEQAVLDDYKARQRPSEFDEEEEDGDPFDEHGWRERCRDEIGVLIHFDWTDWRRIARSRGFLDWHAIQRRIDVGIASFPLDRDVWVTNCRRCPTWVFVPLDELGTCQKDLLAATPTFIHCEDCHRKMEWEASDEWSFELAQDQTSWEFRNAPDEDFEPEPPRDPDEDHRDLLRFELEWDHGPIGCRSRGFPEWSTLYELLGDEIAAGPFAGGSHVTRCYTCSATIVAPVAELRSSIEDRLEPVETIIRCVPCHEHFAWENQEFTAEEMVERTIVGERTFARLIQRMIENGDIVAEEPTEE